VLGVWEFYVTLDAFSVELGQMDSVCTHKAPNRVQLLPEGQDLTLGVKLEKYRVTLSEPNVAKVTLVSTGRSQDATWTMLYDQGLIVETPKTRYFSNFKYTLKGTQHEMSDIQHLDVGSYSSFNSICNKTMVGFV
jgi:hypothetical protein